MTLPHNQIIQGDCREVMHGFPAGSIDLVVTSPPYWGLRSYGEEAVAVWGGDPECEHEWGDYFFKQHAGRGDAQKSAKYSEQNPIPDMELDASFCVKCGAWRGQLGLEPHPETFVAHLVEVCREIKRVLKPSGSFWLNLGDTYYTHTSKRSGQFGKEIKKGVDDIFTKPRKILKTKGWLQEKQLLGIPWRVAAALQNDGWILRNAIVWHKCIGGNVPLYAKSQGKVLRTSIRELARLPLNELYLPGIKNDWRKVLKIEKQPKGKLLSIHLRNGSKIKVTPDHRFPINDKLIEARKLKKGDILQISKIPNEVGTPLGTYDNGWIIGLFLAEGNFEKQRESIELALHKNEDKYYKELSRFALKYGGACSEYNYNNSKMVRITGHVPVAIIRNYVNGETAKNKHLSRNAFNESNNFLRGLLNGFLAGDGYYDEKNNRWRVKLTTNREFEQDLKTICNRIGFFIRSRWRKAKGFGKEYPCIDFEIRTRRTGHFNQKDDYEVMRILKVQGISYEITVDGDHLFLLNDGVVSHNSNAMPSSVKDRLSNTYEFVFLFVKRRRYWFDLNAIRKPYISPIKTLEIRTEDCFTNQYSKSAHGPEDYHPRGKNPGDLWEIPTRPFRGAHFAVFPPALIEPIVKAGCPRWVCPKCGKPRTRITKTEYLSPLIQQDKYKDTPDAKLGKTVRTEIKRWEDGAVHETVGWSDCGCGKGFVSGVVLDPFCGSGTTLRVARKLGRCYIGIEISPEYCEMARRAVKTDKYKPPPPGVADLAELLEAPPR